MRFGAILALVQGSLNQGRKYAILSTFLELSFESGFRYPFERYAWTYKSIRFGFILAHVKGWLN